MSIQHWKNHIKAEGIPFDFDVNEWGSSQYSNCLAIFKLYNKLRNGFSVEETLEILGITFKYSKLRFWEDAINEICISQLDNVNESKNDESFTTEVELLYNLTICVNADLLFNIYKNVAYDLWSAADLIFNFFFDNNEITVPNAPGIGPELNQEVQSQGFKTGIQCALLMEYGVVKDEHSFANFDI